jgi:hypothetical protein
LCKSTMYETSCFIFLLLCIIASCAKTVSWELCFHYQAGIVQGCSNMTGTCVACLHTNQSRSYLNHLVYKHFILSQLFYHIDFLFKCGLV